MAGIRVLQVAMRLDPAVGGSSSSTVTNIVAEQRQGVDSTVVFTVGSADSARTRPVAERLRAAGATVRPFPRARRPAAAAAQFGLSRAAARWLGANVEHYDVVHAHGPWGATSAWCLLLARRHGIPTVLTARESLTVQDRDTSQSRLRAIAKTAAWRVIPKLADIVVYTSELERDASLASGRLGSRIVWHAVVDDAAQMPTPRLLDTGRSDIVAGYLGRFTPKKNIPVLLEAIGADTRLSLILAGSGNDHIEDVLRRRTKDLGIAGRVTFLGRISGEARPDFFARIDVLVLPSEFENFGMAAAEAMEYGVPVLLSRATGLSEVLRVAGGGKTVDVEPNAIAREILALGSHARDPAFARAVQEAVYSRLSFSAHARRAFAVYSEIVQEGPAWLGASDLLEQPGE